MAADLPLPERELIHGYLLMRDASGEERKMSKSLGNVLDPFEVMDEFGTDALRFYCFREVSFGQDGGVSTKSFERALPVRARQRLRQPRQPHAGDDRALPRRRRARRRTSTRSWRPTSTGSRAEVCALLDRAEVTQALDRIWERVRRLNRYVGDRAPWQLAKDEAKAGRARRDAALARRGDPRRSRCCCTRTCPRPRRRCSTRSAEPDRTLEHAAFGARPGGATVTRIAPLFPKPQQ